MEQASARVAVLERAALDAIRELDADNAAGLLSQVLALYLQASPPLIEQIRRGLDTGDANLVRIAAHTLKSSSANLGARELAQMCAALERAARDGELSGDVPTADRISGEFDAVRRALELESGRAAP